MIMEQKKISLIVPVYNCEKYLRPMTGSILDQGWDNLQIILSEDGSTDGSRETARALSEEYPCITLVTGENRGVSAARNRALAVAEGEYIGFCDADDSLLPGYLKTLAELLEEYEADVACCGFQRVYEASGAQDKMPPRDAPVTVTDREGFHTLLLRPDGYTTVMWNKLFRREALLDGTGQFFRFDETIHIVEDGELTFRLPIQKAVFTAQPLYRYVVRKSGAMYGKLNPRKKTELMARRKIAEYCQGESQRVRDLARMKYQKGVRDLMFHAVIDGQGKDVRDLRGELDTWKRELYASPALSKKEKLKYRVYRPIITLNLRRLGGFLMNTLSNH